MRGRYGSHLALSINALQLVLHNTGQSAKGWYCDPQNRCPLAKLSFKFFLRFVGCSFRDVPGKKSLEQISQPYLTYLTLTQNHWKTFGNAWQEDSGFGDHLYHPVCLSPTFPCCSKVILDIHTTYNIPLWTDKNASKTTATAVV
jgi:hypothetical protein